MMSNGLDLQKKNEAIIKNGITKLKSRMEIERISL